MIIFPIITLLLTFYFFMSHLCHNIGLALVPFLVERLRRIYQFNVSIDPNVSCTYEGQAGTNKHLHAPIQQREIKRKILTHPLTGAQTQNQIDTTLVVSYFQNPSSTRGTITWETHLLNLSENKNQNKTTTKVVVALTCRRCWVSDTSVALP